jgi:hypothetical protein
MKPFRSNDVYSATLPLYYVSRFLGLASYSYKIHPSANPAGPIRNRNNADTCGATKQFQTSKCAVVYTGVMLVALLIWLVYSLVWKILYDFSDMKVTYAVTQIMTMCLLASTTVASLGLELTSNRKRLKKVMLKLNQADKILMPDINNVHKKMSGLVLLELVVFVFLLLARHGYELWSSGGNAYINVIIRLVIHFMSTVVIIQFVSFTYMLKQRFRCVNRQLSLLGDNDDRGTSLGIVKVEFIHQKMVVADGQNTVVVQHADDTPSSNSLEQASTATSIFLSDAEIGHLSSFSSSSKFRSQSRPQDVANIHTLRGVHTILHDVDGLVNSVYGFQLLLATAYIFTSVVKYFHIVMMSKVRAQPDQLSNFRVDGILPLMCVVSIHIASVLWVTVSCNSACCEAVRTATVVNKLLLIQALSSDVSVELERFSQQLLHSKLQFTAFGFFSLDFTFLYGFVGGATTYIVILLQFQ